MQSPHAIAGHQPKKITLNKYGGGTTTFGSSYQPPRGFVPKPSPYSEQYTPQASMQQRDMYDSAPPSQAYSPQQYQQYQAPPQQQYQPPPQQQYQPPPQQQYQPPPQQQYQPPPQQQYQPQQQAYEPPPSHPGMQQPDYVRSSDPVEEEEYEYVPVSQRKKQFVNSPSGPSRIRPKKKLVMHTAASGYASFGTDYTKTPTGTPQSAQPRPPPPPQKPQRPINAAPDDALQTRDLIDANAPWNQSLRSSGGPRPWEHEGGDYVMPSQREQMQSSPKPKAPPKQPKPQVVKVAQQPQQPAAPAQSKITIRSVSNEALDADKTGPSVVHLQYNSPIGLYSDANVQNTFNAQTQGRPASQTQSSGNKPQGQPGQPGDRDWNQSYVYRMLQEQSSSQRQVYPPQQQQQQSAPIVSQTYQSTQKSWSNIGDDEIGISEF
ncbi:hypothetical protein KUTeg_003725 [Tegillarca granosa]|uniref:Zasp-like motif domain-containing protein n=1 Tax=Tegillarca granosa TaxID=220873 RepID=A0ABQ9FMW2_TEGGR|nr:hypothetical protein KUTeg_003725 [Tegillarca granosa]